jgi:thiamine-phosphate pyrophosphorylase
MMTDERMGAALWQAIERLPRGAGVVVRHYSLPTGERLKLIEKVAKAGRKRRLVVVAAQSPHRWYLAGHHGHPVRSGRGLKTAPVHNRREIVAAQKRGAHLLFLSPAFPTRSHPDASPLGRVRFNLLARTTRLPVVALGAMTRCRARSLGSIAYGWAAIDAWIGDGLRT